MFLSQLQLMQWIKQTSGREVEPSLALQILDAIVGFNQGRHDIILGSAEDTCVITKMKMQSSTC